MSLRRTRHCEARLTGTQETWKLLGAGSVGSQALTGMAWGCQGRDRAAELGCLFDTPADIAPSELQEVVNEEGWVLRIGP